MRLDKYLSDMHIGTRQEVRRIIRAGQVRVGGVVVKDAGAAVGPTDEVLLGGSKIRHQAHFYYMLNKPAGLLSATEDAAQATVLDLFPEKLRRGLFPIGRLDKDTVGLMLLTDDGELAHRLLSPKSHVDKRYFLRTDSPMTDEDQAACAGGMTLADGTRLMPAELEISPEDPCQAILTIREGKYHQVKRMLAARGRHVVYLKRLSMGPITLDPALAEGEWRPLTEAELSMLARR